MRERTFLKKLAREVHICIYIYIYIYTSKVVKLESYMKQQISK